VPLLTLIGESFAARVAASLLTTLGLPELVCDSLASYVEAAVGYASDAPALAAVRDRIATGRHASPLFNGQRSARDLEQLLLRMVARQDAGLAPEPLAASPAIPSSGVPA